MQPLLPANLYSVNIGLMIKIFVIPAKRRREWRFFRVYSINQTTVAKPLAITQKV
jgi:hypothetical protein